MKNYTINKENNSKLFCFTGNVPFADSGNEYIEGEEYSLEDAEQLLLELLESEPDNLEALSNLFIIEVLKNRMEEALDLLNHILKIDPANQFASESINMMLKLSA